MIFSIIVRKKYLYGAFKIIFSPETFSTSLGHTGDNLERRFRHHLGGRGLMLQAYMIMRGIKNKDGSKTVTFNKYPRTDKITQILYTIKSF